MSNKNRFYRENKVTIANADLKTLNATPVAIIPAPTEVGEAIVDVYVQAYYVYATAAFDSVGSGDDLSFKYTDGSGAKVCGDIETTGWLDQSSSAWRATGPVVTTITPVANAAVVAQILTGEIYGAAGGGYLVIKSQYRIVDLSV